MISVIMSVYNNEDTLEESIRSILNQTYSDFEFLILDDCSTDLSFEIINRFKNIDSRIRVFKNVENLGLTKSLNFLLEQSKYDYIARHDSDDISKLNRLETQFFYLNNNKYQFCVSRAEQKSTNRIIPKWSFYFPSRLVMKYKNPFIHGTLMIKKASIFDIGMYDEKFYFAQDYKLFRDLLKQKIKFKYLSKSLYILNMDDNISSNYRNEQKYYFDCAKNDIKP